MTTLSGTRELWTPLAPRIGMNPRVVRSSIGLFSSATSIEIGSPYALSGPADFGNGFTWLGTQSADATGFNLHGEDGELRIALPGPFVELQGTITFARIQLGLMGRVKGEYLCNLLEPLVFPPEGSAFTAASAPLVIATFTGRIGNAVVLSLPAAGLLLIGGHGTLAMVRRRRTG